MIYCQSASQPTNQLRIIKYGTCRLNLCNITYAHPLSLPHINWCPRKMPIQNSKKRNGNNRETKVLGSFFDCNKWAIKHKINVRKEKVNKCEEKWKNMLSTPVDDVCKIIVK